MEIILLPINIWNVDYNSVTFASTRPSCKHEQMISFWFTNDGESMELLLLHPVCHAANF